MHAREWTERARRYLRELQRSDERRKRRWLMISSGVSVALVFLLWIVYLNINLPAIPGTTATTTPPAASPTEEDSFLEILGRGFSLVWGRIEDETRSAADKAQRGAAALQRSLSAEREFTFEAPTSSTERPDLEPTSSMPRTQ